VPAGRRAAGPRRGPLDARRDRTADGPRPAAPHGLRPCRARGARRDVRHPGPPARRLVRDTRRLTGRVNVTALLLAAVLALVAGLLVSIDAAISAFSKARAEELAESGHGGA